MEKWNDKTIDTKPDFLFAGDMIINFLLNNETVNHPMFLVDLGEGQDGEELGSCLFLCISKALYGTSGYFYCLRQFFYYYYKNIAELNLTHSYFADDPFAALLLDIIDRVYADKVPPNTIEEDGSVNPEKIPRILKELALKYLNPSFWGCYQDTLVFAALFKYDKI